VALAGRLRPVAQQRARRAGGYGGHPGVRARHRPLARPAVCTPDPEEPVLKAAAADQLRLLDLQSLDTRLDQLAHRRRTLPEHAALAELDTELGSLRDQIVVAETEQSDLARELKKAEGDVDQVRARAERDQKRLDAGQVSSPKELEGLQHEIATLARRQSDLEEIVLDVMERLESAQSRASELGAQQETARARAAELTAGRDTTTAGIDADATQLGAQRATQASAIDAALITLYEKIREQQGGVGAAELRQRRCGGCRLELNNVEINELRDADPDEVMRCDECRRILVRTGESGL
jgi:predicted  nucleic acid-binding Zn-ribbon protein